MRYFKTRQARYQQERAAEYHLQRAQLSPTHKSASDIFLQCACVFELKDIFAWKVD